MATNSYGWVTNAGTQGQQDQMRLQQQQMQNDYARQAQGAQGQSALGMGGNQNGYGAAYQQMGRMNQGMMGQLYQQGYQAQQQAAQRPPTGAPSPQGPAPQGPTGPSFNQGNPSQNFSYGAPPTGGYPQASRFNYTAPINQANYANVESLLGNFNNYANKDWRSQQEDYRQSAQMMLNYDLQNRDQAFNQQYTTQNFGEQQRLNDFNMQMQNQANWRENTDLNFSMDKYRQDFNEAQRQYNQGLNLNYAQLQGQNQFQQGQLKNEAFSNNTALQNVQNQYSLGRLQNETQREQIYRENMLGNKQADIQAQNYANQFQLGQGQNSNQLLSIQNQMQLGQGQLGLGNRELNLNDAYRYKQLAQEDALTRQRLANEMTQSRYAAFGRAQAPNFRMMNSYR